MYNLRNKKPTVTLKLHLFRSEIVLLHLAELQMRECSVILRIVSSHHLRSAGIKRGGTVASCPENLQKNMKSINQE